MLIKKLKKNWYKFTKLDETNDILTNLGRDVTNIQPLFNIQHFWAEY